MSDNAYTRRYLKDPKVDPDQKPAETAKKKEAQESSAWRHRAHEGAKGLNWEPQDYIVAALALCIIIGMLTLLGAVIFIGKQLNPDQQRIAENTLSAITAIFSMYIGAKIPQRRDDDKCKVSTLEQQALCFRLLP